MARNVFQIEQGKFWLAPVGTADNEGWLAPSGRSVTDVTEADYTADGGDWSCQVQSGAITASPNLTTTTVEADFCNPAEEIPQPGATSFAVDITARQDPNIVDGINRFLFEHDTEEIYVMLGLNGTDPPKAIGRARAIAGAVGGAARTTLTFDVSLPLTGKPQILFGNAGGSEAVPASIPIVGPDRASASPGDVFDADTDITAQDATNAGKLTAEGFIADPQTAWLYNQAINVGPYSFHWSGTAWTAGPAPGVPATGATAGAPGTWTPVGSRPPATVTALIAGTPNTVAANPTANWSAGQSVEAVDGGDAHWNGTTWVAGTHP